MKSPMMRLYTAQQVADILGNHIETVRKIPKKDLPRVIIGPRTIRYTEFDIQNYIAKKRKKA